MLVALCPQINQNLIELELELLVGLVRKLDVAAGRLLLGFPERMAPRIESLSCYLQ